MILSFSKLITGANFFSDQKWSFVLEDLPVCLKA